MESASECRINPLRTSPGMRWVARKSHPSGPFFSVRFNRRRTGGGDPGCGVNRELPGTV